MNDQKIAFLPEPFLSIHKTCKYISLLPTMKGFKRFPKSNRDKEINRKLKDSIFRKRTLDQIFKEGYFLTCSDIGLLFRGLRRFG